MPDLKKLRGVFGIDLTTLLNAHSSTIPFVVVKCVKEIESRGMEQEGIYRISGFADEIEALKIALDKCECFIKTKITILFMSVLTLIHIFRRRRN